MEARIFNDAQLNVRKCKLVLVRLLYLLNQGESFRGNQAVELFFGTTKLFQGKDEALRRLTYLLIRELSVQNDQAIIVIASLIKDMNNSTGNENFKSSAIRVLCRLVDSNMLAQIERHLKQAIMDKAGNVSSAALVSGYFLLEKNTELVKRWSQEVYDALSSKNVMSQYHALGLYHEMKRNDRLAIIKMIQAQTKFSGTTRSPYTHLLLIRYCVQVINETDGDKDIYNALYEYLENCLRNRSDMVIVEAAKGISELKSAGAKEMASVVSVLQLYLNSPKPVLRFSAVKALSTVANRHSIAVSICNIDLEALLTDPNRSIATLAVTTLLKTGSEATVDKIIKNITQFVSEVNDEFKIVVIDAVRALSLKFPKKYRTFLSFLSTILREEGGFEYKKAIIDTILTIMRDVPESQELALPCLCEFIEDCEYTALSCQILNLLGEEGPKAQNPSRFIRFIYNRIILENANVRGSAITALGKFGIKVPSLRPYVRSLLQASLHDHDDEVRERSQFYISILGTQDLIGADYVEQPMPVPLTSLRRELESYLASGNNIAPFELANVRVKPDDVVKERKAAAAAAAAASGGRAGGADGAAGGGAAGAGAGAGENSPGAANAAKKPAVNKYLSELSAFPQLANLISKARIVKSSTPEMLTPAETEYQVKLTKHIFSNNIIILQFDCCCSLTEVLHRNVIVKFKGIEGFEIACTIPIEELKPNVQAPTYVALRATDGLVTCEMSCFLDFDVFTYDAASGDVDPDGYKDQYELNDLEITLADFLSKYRQLVPTTVLTGSEFARLWESDKFKSENGGEVVERYALSFKTVPLSLHKITTFFDMDAFDGTDKITANPPPKSHTLLLAGFYGGEFLVAIKCLFAELNGGITVEISVRSENKELAELLASSIG